MTNPQPRLRIRLLGEPEIWLDGRRIDGEMGQRARELLMVLALEPDRAQPRERLMTTLWPDKRPDRASANLRRALFLLRNALDDVADDVLVAADGTLALRLAAVEIDRQALERCLADGRPEAVRRALGLYRGDLLEDVYDEWVIVERETLRRRVLEAAHRGARELAEGGQPAAALEVCRHVLRIDRLDEKAHALSIALLRVMGDRAGALAHYETCRDLLARELGVTPSPAIEQEHERTLDGAGMPVAQPLSVPPAASSSEGAAPSDATDRPRRLDRTAVWLAVAAVVLLAAGGTLLWRVVDRAAAVERTKDELVNEHIVASYMEDLPVRGADPTVLDAWFRDRVTYAVDSTRTSARELQLYGGGLCDLSGQIAATAVYRTPSGARVSVFQFPVGRLALPQAETVEAGLRGFRHADHSVVLWQTDGRVYAVVSDLALEELTELAREMAGA